MIASILADLCTDRAIARLEAALAQLGRDVEPPAGWQARVLAAIARDEVAIALVNRALRPQVRAWPWGS